MTKAETVKLLSAISLLWPRVKDPADPERARMGVELWHDLIGDVDYHVAMTAVKVLAVTSRYQPTIAEVRQEIARITDPEPDLTSGQAWEAAKRAISAYGYYQESAAMRSLPPRVAQAVQAIGWQDLCGANAATIGVERGQFCRAYDQQMAQTMRTRCLPAGLHQEIKVLTGQTINIRGLLPDINDIEEAA